MDILCIHTYIRTRTYIHIYAHSSPLGKAADEVISTGVAVGEPFGKLPTRSVVLQVCMYVCIYIYICMCMYACMYVYVRLFVGT